MLRLRAMLLLKSGPGLSREVSPRQNGAVPLVPVFGQGRRTQVWRLRQVVRCEGVPFRWLGLLVNPSSRGTGSALHTPESRRQNREPTTTGPVQSILEGRNLMKSPARHRHRFPHRSIAPSLHRSITPLRPPLHYSITPSLHHCITPATRCPG